MTTPVQNAIAAALTVTNAAAGQAVTFARGGITETLTVTLGSSQFDRESSGDVIATFETVDFLLDPVALAALVAAAGLPQVGDTITTANGRIHKVVHGAGEKPYRFMDQFRTALRIHTTHTGETA